MTEPRKPQDRLSKQVDTDEHPEGWEMLKPFDTIPAWDQMDLIAAVSPLEALSSGKWKSSDPRALRAMAAVAKALIPCVRDEDEYVRFASGSGGIARSVNLAAAFAAELGKFEDSATS